MPILPPRKKNSQNVVSKTQRNSAFHISCAFVCVFLGGGEYEGGDVCVCVFVKKKKARERGSRSDRNGDTRRAHKSRRGQCQAAAAFYMIISL